MVKTLNQGDRICIFNTWARHPKDEEKKIEGFVLGTLENKPSIFRVHDFSSQKVFWIAYLGSRDFWSFVRPIRDGMFDFHPQRQIVEKISEIPREPAE